MQLSRDYAIWQIATAKQTRYTRRPTLECVYATKDPEWGDVLMAADGFTLAVVPVKFLEGDVLGLIDADTLRKAVRSSNGSKWVDVEIVLLEEHIRFGTGATLPRTDSDQKGGSFPDVRRLIPRLPGPDATISPRLAYDAACLGNLSNALGAGHLVICPNVIEPNGPTLVFPVIGEQASDDEVRPPFGLIMPSQVKHRQRDTQPRIGPEAK